VTKDKRLRVLVDASVLGSAFGGIAMYTSELVRALARDPSLSLTVATSRPHQICSGLDSGVRVIGLGSGTRSFIGRAMWREVRLGDLIRDRRSDVLLTPVPELPLRRTRVPSVVVIHDVSQIAAPALYGWTRWLRYAIGLPLTCASADAVVCVSHAALLGLRQALPGVPAAKLRVVYQGPQPLQPPALTPSHGRPYLLYVGSLLSHKNIETVLAALAEAGPRLPVDFLLTGPAKPPETARLSARVRALGLDTRVRHLGFVDRAQLSTLYEHATGLVLPSLIEGFGLPVVEAMSQGTPVVASDIPAVREVGQDAVLYVGRPLDQRAWIDALVRLWSDESLRGELASRGKARARAFSWDAAGREFSALLHEVAGRT
jgi:glycosyltransferase involved in cell wall biosynthesis